MAARSLIPPRTRRQSDVSLAIMNIVLLLVLFFLVAGTLVRHEVLEADPAETRDLPLERLPRPILLIGAGAEWSLEGVRFAPDALAGALAGLEGPQPPPVLHVLAEADLSADVLLGLMRREELADTALRLVTLHVRPDGTAAPVATELER